MKLFTGNLYLELKDEPEEKYAAEISRAIFRETELVLEFNGTDSHFGSYRGKCTLRSDGTSFVGIGEFTKNGSTTPASIQAIGEHFGEDISLVGHWQDEGESEIYDLQIELEKQK